MDPGCNVNFVKDGSYHIQRHLALIRPLWKKISARTTEILVVTHVSEITSLKSRPNCPHNTEKNGKRLTKDKKGRKGWEERKKG